MQTELCFKAERPALHSAETGRSNLVVLWRAPDRNDSNTVHPRLVKPSRSQRLFMVDRASFERCTGKQKTVTWLGVKTCNAPNEYSLNSPDSSQIRGRAPFKASSTGRQPEAVRGVLRKGEAQLAGRTRAKTRCESTDTGLDVSESPPYFGRGRAPRTAGTGDPPPFTKNASRREKSARIRIARTGALWLRAQGVGPECRQCPDKRAGATSISQKAKGTSEFYAMTQNARYSFV